MKALHHDQPNPTEGARLCFVVLTTKHTNLLCAHEVPSLSFGDASPNGHEGASSRSTESSQRRTTLLRGTDHEGDESGFVPSHPRSDVGRTCVVKATGSDSSLSDSLTDSGTEGIRICFVWLAYEGDKSGFVAAAPKADEGDESGFVAAAPKADEGDESGFGRAAAVGSLLP